VSQLSGRRSTQDTPAAIRFLSVEPLLADLGQVDLHAIDGVIVGGESGPHARPMLRAWVISIRRQCRTQPVPFFFKQWGGRREHETGRGPDGSTYDEFPITFRDELERLYKTLSGKAVLESSARSTANF